MLYQMCSEGAPFPMSIEMHLYFHLLLYLLLFLMPAKCKVIANACFKPTFVFPFLPLLCVQAIMEELYKQYK